MEFRAKLVKLDNIGQPTIILEINKLDEHIEKLLGKEVVIKQYKPKRSTNANNYYWGLIRQLCAVLGTDEDSLHLEMLRRYGVGERVDIKNEAVDSFKRAIKYYIETNKTDTHTTILVLTGSSEMNTKEFATLLDGVISECNDMGIRTLKDYEIDKLIADR